MWTPQLHNEVAIMLCLKLCSTCYIFTQHYKCYFCLSLYTAAGTPKGVKKATSLPSFVLQFYNNTRCQCVIVWYNFPWLCHPLFVATGFKVFCTFFRKRQGKSRKWTCYPRVWLRVLISFYNCSNLYITEEEEAKVIPSINTNHAYWLLY